VRIGYGSAPLPVPDGTPMGGYAARDGASSGVLDHLNVDCISFGGFLLVVADVLCVNEDLAATVRRALAADVWMCATHTHSGPDVGCVPGGGPTPAPWRARIGAAAVEAAGAAAGAEHDLAGRLHSGVLRGIGSRRGADDVEALVSVDVVSFVDRGGRLRGVLAVVPVHPTVLPASSLAISGDLAGAIRAALRRELGGPWVVVATGAAGDISTRRTRREQTPAECRRLGDEAARQIAALMRAAPIPLWEIGEAAYAGVRRRTLLPARPDDRAGLGALRARLEQQHARAADAAAARTLETTLQGVAVAAARPRGRTVPLTLSAARLGRLALHGIAAEPFHSLGEELRARSAGPSVLLGYANGHAGYLTDAAAHATAGYEALSSPFRRDAGATAVAALIDLQADLRRTE
jgi:neutral ceramidase